MYHHNNSLAKYLVHSCQATICLDREVPGTQMRLKAGTSNAVILLSLKPTRCGVRKQPITGQITQFKLVLMHKFKRI